MNVINFRNTVVPMFQPAKELSMTEEEQKATKPTISLFEVKELYDYAYTLKECNSEMSAHNFKDALAAAVKMDMAYRRQLAAQDSFLNKRAKEFSPALDSHKLYQKSKLHNA